MMSFYDFVRRATVSCAQCGARGENLLQCPCRTAFYCDSTCQVSHWPLHKHHCTAVRRGIPTLHRCHYCGESSYQLHSCQCGAALYCGVECQREHWAVHRKGCSCWSFYFEKVHSQFKDQGTQTDDVEEEEDGAFDTDDFGEPLTSDPSAAGRNNSSVAFEDDEKRLGSADFATSNTHMMRSGGGAASVLRNSHTILTRAVSNIRRSVTEIFFTAAKQQQEQQGQHEQLSQVFTQQLTELNAIEDDNRQRVYDEAARGVEALSQLWQVLNGPRLLVQCAELERGRRMRIVAEYNMWAKQATKSQRQYAEMATSLVH